MEEFILYVKLQCPFCIKAESLIKESGHSYKIVPFDENLDLLEHMKWAYSHKTVPMIFLKEEKQIKFVGGYTDLSSYLEERDEARRTTAS